MPYFYENSKIFVCFLLILKNFFQKSIFFQKITIYLQWNQ